MSASGSVELSIIVPVYNELERFEQALTQILEADLPVASREVVIVDDGSTDGTRELLRSREWPAEVRVFEHPANRGKGAAIRTALAEVRGSFTTIMDADLEYDPENIGVLLKPLADDLADAVYGVRGFQSHSAFSFWYVVGNKSVTFAANVLYNRWLADIMTCHKVMRTDLFRSLSLRADGFAIEPEITARLLRHGAQIYEVPISYNARTRQDGKKLTSLDGLRVLATLLRCRFA
jgi:glycosyltransferase involved in cell wall biosynthesis